MRISDWSSDVCSSDLDQRAKLDEGDANRGHRPGKGSGPVTGSGAGAGGKGNPADFDADPQGGGGQAPLPTDRGPKEGADAPIDGSRYDPGGSSRRKPASCGERGEGGPTHGRARR